MEYVAWLFGEAWQRQRRRRRLTFVIGVAACGIAALAYALTGRGPATAPPPPPAAEAPAGTIAQPPSAVFSQEPYMGVRCPLANSIACDRVGLAIWLKRPAYSVRAWIDGRGFAMSRWGDEQVTSRRPRTEFDGYLQPAGIVSNMHVHPLPGTSTWLGDGTGTPSPMVWLLIDYGHGHHTVTHLRVPLGAGWG